MPRTISALTRRHAHDHHRVVRDDTARRVLVLALCGSAALAAGSAWAVLQNVPIVSPAGQPVANTTVTIQLPDGTMVEEETDDRGILIFDFPERGDYLIRYPGGELRYTISRAMLRDAGASGGGVNPLIPALIGGGAALVAINNNNDDDDGPGAAPDGTGGTGGTSSSAPPSGGYTCTYTSLSNPDNHPTASLNGLYTLTFSGTSATVAHTNGPTQFSLQGTLNGSNVSASGTGTFQGFTGAQFNFTGTIAANNSLTVNSNTQCSACPDSNGNGTRDAFTGTLSCTPP